MNHSAIETLVRHLAMFDTEGPAAVELRWSPMAGDKGKWFISRDGKQISEAPTISGALHNAYTATVESIFREEYA